MQQRDPKTNVFQYSLGNEDGSYQRILTKIQMMLGQPSSSPLNSSRQLSNESNAKSTDNNSGNNSNESNNNNSSSSSGSGHSRNNSSQNIDNLSENSSQKKGPKIAIGSTRKNQPDETKSSKTDDNKNAVPPLQHSNSLPGSSQPQTTSYESSSLPSTPTFSRANQDGTRKSFDSADETSEEKSSLNRNRSFGKSTASRKDFWSTSGLSQKESDKTLIRRASVRVSANDDLARDRSPTTLRSNSLQKKKGGTLKRTKGVEYEPETYETDFDFSSSQLSALPSEIGLLFWLKSCNLEDNQLSTLPPSIGELVMLETLKLSHNRITSLPDQIGHLKRLKVLLLDSNQLSKLPVGVGKMKLLEHLNISNNLITYLPSELSDCIRLQVLSFENNPIVFPPKNILSEGPVQTVGYLKTLLMGSKPSNRLKYFLLGKEQSGKSSLLSCLKTRKGRSKSKYIPSRGLDMDSWNMDVEIEEENVGKNTTTNVNYITYDFSGNDMLLPLHEAFFSDFGIYCITWDMTLKEDGVAGLEFYLKAIDGKAKNASIIVVGTHLDDKMFEDDPNLADSLGDKIIEKYCSDFPNIKGVVSVSCTTYKGIDFLRSTIERISATPPCVNYFYKDFVPLRYFALEDLILAEKSRRGPSLGNVTGSVISPGGLPTLTWRKFLSLASIVSLNSDTMLSGALDFLNWEVGTVLHFNDISDDLKSFLFLDPPSIYEAVNGILGFNVAPTSLSNSGSGQTASPMSTPGENDQPGVFQHSLVDKIWPHCSKELKRGLLSMMVTYKLMLELPRVADTEIETQASILPFLLPPEPRETMQLVVPEGHIKMERSFMFNTQIPESLFHHLLSSLHQLHFHHRKEITKSFWRFGIVFADSRNNAAQVTYNRNQQSITIMVCGPTHPETLLREIVHTIELLISNWFPSSEVECIIKFANMKLFMSDIEQAVSQNERTFSCNGVWPLSDIVPDLTLKDKSPIRVEFNKLAIKREVGQGAFGLISEAEYNDTPVALKQITTTTKEETMQAYKDWYRELSVMSLLHHDNIANLVGFCGKPQCIIMEYVPHGTLFDFLRNPQYWKTGSFFDWDLILKIATDIAEGMNYMHSLTPPVVHRDLKTPNILVYSTDRSDKIMMKIADFGTATPLYIPELRERLVDQPLWLAPEVMMRKPYNQKVDVYAYAIILWELLTKEHPFDEFPFAQWSAQLEDSIIAGTRPMIPSNCLAGYKKLITECWSSSPRQRPSFEGVLQQLSFIKTNLRKSTDSSGLVEEVEALQTYKFDLPDTEDCIVLEEAANRDKYVTQIKAASPTKLIERFTKEKERDFDYVMHFLLTSPLFCRFEDLLRLIQSRYEGPPPTAMSNQISDFQKNKPSIRLRILLILQKWLGLLTYEYDTEPLNHIEEVLSSWTNKTEDGEYPPGKVKVDLLTSQPTPELLVELKAFVKEVEESSKDSMEKKVLAKMQRKKLEYLENVLAESDPSLAANQRNTLTKIPERKPTQLGSENPMKTLDARELAEQWTLLECQFLQSIRPEEFLGQAWHREHKEKLAPSLSAYVDWFTQIRNWVSTEVLKGESVAERKEMIEFFIQVAMRLFEMHNYNGVTEVLSSLHGDAMSHLQLSWKDVNKKASEQLDVLTKMMSPHKNFKSYRGELKSIQNDTPYVPYLGVFLNDFIFLDETKEWHYPSSASEMINFEKVKTMGESLMNFQTSQHVSRIFNSKIPVNPKIQEYILSAEIWESEDLVRLAQLKEECKDRKIDPSRKYITGRSNIATDIDSLSPREWDLLLTNARTIIFAKDEVVFEEGSFNRMLYRIKSGKFRVEKKVKDNIRGLSIAVITKLEPPAMFGEMSFLGMKTTASIVCDEENAELFVLEIKLVKTLFSADPDLFRIFYQYLATILAKRLKGVGQSSAPATPQGSQSTTPSQSPSATPSTTPGTTPGVTPITSPGSSPHNSSSSFPAMDRRSTVSTTKDAQKANKEKEKEKDKDKKDKRGKTQSSPETGREEDIKFRKKFGLPDNEIIIKEFTCTLKKVTGKLYLSQQHVCFYGTVFGMSRKKAINIQTIKEFTKGNKSSIVVVVDANTKFLFSEDKDRDAAYDMLESLFKTSKSRPMRSTGIVSVGSEELRRQIKQQDSESEDEDLSSSEDYEALTPEDWDDLLEGAKLLLFKKGDTIISEGENFQRIYQLVEGECRIEKGGKVLGKMEDGQFFGEISFLLSGGATATIVADSDEVHVYVLEGYFMNILFGIRPELAGRFYKHLANVLQKRIRSRDEALASKKSFPPAPKAAKQPVSPVKRSVFMNNMSPEKNNNNNNAPHTDYNPYKMQKSGKVMAAKQNKRSSLVIVSKTSQLTTSQDKVRPVPVEIAVKSDLVLAEQTDSVKNLVNRYQNIIAQKQTKQQ